jgi:hypothetical protein
MSAKTRYDYLASDRSQFLNVARQAADLTLPYLNRGEEEFVKGARHLPTPWQSVGAKGVVTLASKLMLALLPPQTSFFKLQVDDTALGTDFPPEVRSELDLSFAKIERTILESIAASSDRVVVHQALKHLGVAGNALIFMGKDQLKLYPLNRYVVERDGNGNVLEIVTKERISKKLLMKVLPQAMPNSVAGTEAERNDEADIYTHIRRDNNRFVWHQEYEDKIIPGSMGKAPIEANPWLVLRFNTVDGEVYGRGRVEEFIGDLRSLEALSQALVEGSAAAAKVVFVVSPSSTTKPATLAAAGNGAIVQGRPDDIGVIQVGKTADFRTAYEMMQSLERRLSEAFLILSVRQSERTTAEEVRMTQMELEQQLGGLFSLLTTEFLVPYLNRKLNVFQKTGQIPRLPKDIVKPTIVAGVNALGRGQDRESLAAFMTTIAQTMGPEAIAKYINSIEVVKRLAAAQGIDVLNLVKTEQQMQGEMQRNMAMQKDMAITQQIGQLAKTPILDPSKNPQAMEMINGQSSTQSPDAIQEQASAASAVI